MENLKEKIKQVLKQLSFYTIISISFIAGTSIGYYYDLIKKSYHKEPKFTSVKKSEVIIAIDEYQRYMIIDKKTGNYTVYEDSIGVTFFNIHARNIWGQAAAPSTPKIEK
jgi:predicted GTPase